MLAMLVIIIWALAYVVIRATVRDMTIPPFTFAFLRFTLAAVILEFIPAGKTDPKPRGKDAVAIFAMGFFAVFLYFAFENYGLVYTSATNAAILVSLIPVFTMMGVAVIYKQKASVINWLGVIPAVAGTALVVFNGRINLHLEPAGDMLIALSSASWAVYTLIGRGIVDRYHPVTITRYNIRNGALMFLPFAIYEYSMGQCGNITLQSLGGVVYLGVFCTVFAFIIWNSLLSRLGVVFLSNLLYCQCIFTAAAAWFFLGERVTLMLAIGTAILLSGIYLTNYGVRSGNSGNPAPPDA